MHRIWVDIRNHRLASALFIAWLLALMLLNFIVSRRTQESVAQLHFVPPMIAGALICWWRRFSPEKITSGTLAGATVLVVNFALMLPRELTEALARGKGLLGVLRVLFDVEVLAFAAFGCVIGAVLGFVGAIAAVALAHVEKVSEGTPAAGLAGTADAIPACRIMPHRLLIIAGGLVLAATVVLASAPFGRALPPPLTRVNLLAAAALLVPISRWSNDAGRALVLIAGLLCFSLGCAVLVAAGFTWAERSVMLSVALTAGALAELGAGFLALRATFREAPVHYAA